MKSFITAIGTANPDYRFPQMKIAEFMTNAVSLSRENKLKLKSLYKSSGIGYRYSVIPDFGLTKGQYQFFPNTDDLEPFPSVGHRMKVYERKALPLAISAINNCMKNNNFCSITHLITVSCTGMYAPGLDIEIIQQLGLRKDIVRTCINYMGCYAAFNAFKLADTFCKADPNARVLIVCVEICTIHYQKKQTPDFLLSNALFGDGAGAALVEGKASNNVSLSIDMFNCDIAFQGRNEMAWNISDFGFEMALSSYVPELIQSTVRDLTCKLLSKLELTLKNVDHFAIHPGGKKILDVIRDELKVRTEKIKTSYEVLFDYGNMSSASILFVLQRLLNELSKSDINKKILSLAFGPGITLESMLLTVTCRSNTKKLLSVSNTGEPLTNLPL
ncbi:MAG TPA: type III polyketide synthase [Cytophagaceae bacterium]